MPVKGVLAPSQIVWDGIVTLDRDTVIPAETTLIIKPGTIIRFGDYKDPAEDHPDFAGVELIVKGKIKAVGTKEEPIFFTAVNQRPAAMGYWGAVNLVGGKGGEFVYCQFEFADTGLHSQSTSLRVANCRFFYNQKGLRFSDCDPLVINSVFFNNETAIQYHNASPQIINCQITDNLVGVFCRFGSRETRITYNNIFNNYDYNIKLGEEQSFDVLAVENYWGEDGSPLDKIYDWHKSNYIGRVIITPQANEKFPLAEDLL